MLSSGSPSVSVASGAVDAIAAGIPPLSKDAPLQLIGKKKGMDRERKMIIIIT